MDIRDAAVKYLAPRARTCQEIRNYLTKKEFDREEIEALIREFEALHYLDDKDYCLRYIEYGFEKGRGAYRVRRELEEKGVDRETIAIAFEEYEDGESELKRAEKQAEKIAAGRKIDEKLLGRMGRRLSSLGYSADVVYQILGTYMRKQDE